MARTHRRLRLAPLAPALAALAAASLLLWRLLPGLLEEGAARQLLETLDLLTPIVAARAADPPAALQAWVERTAGGSELRLTIVAADGRVIAESTRSFPTLGAMENHAGRPEVAAALARGRGWAVRRSATTGRPYVYAARTFTGAGERLLVLRLAQPLDELAALSGHLAAALGLAVAAALAALALVSWRNDRRLFQPLSALAAGAGQLASGRTDHRVQVPDDPELAGLAQALNRLGAAVESQLAAAQRERDHLRSILASMSEGVLVVGADRRALLANPAFERLFGLQGEVAGRPVLEIVRRPEVERLIERTLDRGSGDAIEIDWEGPDRRNIELRSDALFGPSPGAAQGAVLAARDTTAGNRLNEMRRDFVANVSHELKTPLSAIRGFAETLADGALEEPEVAARFTGRILDHCQRLEALLDDLLTLSRLESVAAPSEREPVDLGDLARRALEVLTPAAEERRVTLALEAREGVTVSGDADGLERMLVNVLANAVKYNRPGGSVRVRVAGGEGTARIEVEDTGIGIPQEALPRIFERFYRVDKGRSREEGGTGLGLAIVKHVAQAHGGQVEVASRLGQGSTFRILLPAA